MRSVVLPDPESSVIVPVPRFAGSASHSAVGASEPLASNVITDAVSPTSCVPERVKMLTLLWSVATTLISMSCES